ncbi:MAG: hypothetical protein IJV71_12035 [Lachnospiraceae bacterium]|nr:hypothetical protein [Lachnospiraceae bacterium]
MGKSRTVIDVMRSDMGLVNMAELMHAKFGCPGKDYPCIKKYTSGVKICEGCWVNYFNTQVPDIDTKGSDIDETTKETYSDPEEID